MFFFFLFFLPLICASAEEAHSFPPSIPTLFESYPELFLLAKKEPLPKELIFPKEKSYSCALFQENFVELDRALNAINCFSLILEGTPLAYEELVANQPAALRLTKESFSTLHKIAENFMKSHPKIPESEMVRLAKASIILKALERSKKILPIKEKGELFGFLSKEAKEFLFEDRAAVNYAPIFHLEGGRELFDLLKEKIHAKKVSDFFLDFDLFISFCFLATREDDASLELMQETFLSYQIVCDSLRLLSSCKQEEAYLLCLEKRASLLNIDLKKSSDRAQVRIASLLRLSSPVEGKLLKEAFHALSYAPKESIYLQFDEKRAPATTPLYLSDFLMNIFHAPVALSQKEKMQKTVSCALPLLAQILKEYQERVSLGHLDPKTALNFQKAALFVKEHFQDLDKLSYQIDKEGIVTLFVLQENAEKKS